MEKISDQQTELFFDVLDQSASLLHQVLKEAYLEMLVLATNFILDGEVSHHELDEETITQLETMLKRLEGEAINKEEMRKAFQLCLLKGFKHLNMSLSEITPDSVGILFAYLADQLFPSHTSINLLDATIGSGNLIVTMLNHLSVHVKNTYGVDVNYTYLQLALSLAELTDYHIELIHQDSTKPLMVPKVDLVISDLPILPYQIVQNLMNQVVEGGYFIYLIPNDFFDQKQDIMKDVILEHTFMKALISLPKTMFKTEEAQKSILILQKRGPNMNPRNEVLIFNFPSFHNPQEVKKALDQINQWFKNNKNMEV